MRAVDHERPASSQHRLPAVGLAALAVVGLVGLACAGIGSAHPSPSDYGADLDIGVDALFAKAGYTPTALATRQMEAGMLETLNMWYGKDKEKRRFFAVSVFSRDWEIHRSRSAITSRSVCGAFFWLDDDGLCHVNGHEVKQNYDGSSYSDTMMYHEECFFPTDAPNRRYLDPLNVFEGRSSETTTAIYRGPGLLIEACSDPSAFAAFIADAEAKAQNAKPKPPPKKRAPEKPDERVRRR